MPRFFTLIPISDKMGIFSLKTKFPLLALFCGDFYLCDLKHPKKQLFRLLFIANVVSFMFED